MTVTTSNTTVSYTGDAATVVFPTTFAFFTSADIEVIERITSTGVETTKTLTTDYTVSGGSGTTGDVTAVTAPASTVKWTIRRILAETQATDLPVAGAFPSTGVEQAIDRGVMMVQQHSDELRRALVFPKTDAAALSPEIPNSVDRASKLLAFDATGLPIARALADGGTGTMSDLTDDSTPQLSAALDTNGNAINESEGTAVASAATTDIWATDGNTLHVTGTATITSLGTAPRVGARRRIIADGAFVLTHAANLNCPGSANITAAAGDTFDVYADTTTQLDIQNFSKIDGTAVVVAAGLPRSYLAGLGMSNDTDTAHDIAIAVGECRDAANSVNMVNSAIITKQIDATWAAGDDAGGMEDGDTVGVSEWFHVFLISTADGATVDAGFDTSITAANLLADAVVAAASLTKYRRIGAVLTDGSSNILAFTQVGDDFRWADPQLDVNSQAVTTTAATITLSTPIGVKCWADFNFRKNAAAGYSLYFSSLDMNDEAAATLVEPLGQIGNDTTSGGGWAVIRTNTSSAIRVVSETTTNTIEVATLGYLDARGRNA